MRFYAPKRRVGNEQFEEVSSSFLERTVDDKQFEEVSFSLLSGKDTITYLVFRSFDSSKSSVTITTNPLYRGPTFYDQVTDAILADDRFKRREKLTLSELDAFIFESCASLPCIVQRCVGVTDGSNVEGAYYYDVKKTAGRCCIGFMSKVPSVIAAVDEGGYSYYERRTGCCSRKRSIRKTT